MKTAQQLRMMQVACVLVVLGCVLLSWFRTLPTRRGFSLIHLVVIVAAIWSAVVGFTLQRKIVNRTTQVRSTSTKSTPLRRWKAGHIVRLLCANSVGLSGLLLDGFGGPSYLVYSLFTLGLFLLVIWVPGAPPPEQDANTSVPRR